VFRVDLEQMPARAVLPGPPPAAAVVKALREALAEAMAGA